MRVDGSVTRLRSAEACPPVVQSPIERVARGSLRHLLAVFDAVVAEGASLPPDVVAALARTHGVGAPRERTATPARGEAAPFFAAEEARLEDAKSAIPAEMVAQVDVFNAARAKEGKPPIDLAETTAELDAIMQDPSLSDDQKDKAVLAVQKRLDIPDNAGFLGMNKVNMHDMFTGRLGALYRESKDRVAAHREAETKALKVELAETAAVYGADSSEVRAVQAQLEEVDAVHKSEEQRRGKIGDKLYDKCRAKGFFEAIGSFFAAIGSVIAKIVDFVMPVIKLIPGVGQIAGAIWGGVKGVVAAVQGDWQGVVSAVAGAIPLVGDAIGGIAKGVIEVGKKVWDVAKGGVQAVTSLVRGDVAGALAGAAGSAGAAGAPAIVSDVLDKGARAATSVEHLVHGDVIGALGGAARLADDLGVPGVKDVVARASAVAAPVVDAVERTTQDLRDELSRALQALPVRGARMQRVVDRRAAPL